MKPEANPELGWPVIEWTDESGQRVVIDLEHPRLAVYGWPSLSRTDGYLAVGADPPEWFIRALRQAYFARLPRPGETLPEGPLLGPAPSAGEVDCMEDTHDG
jgi:hypothetical protein